MKFWSLATLVACLFGTSIALAQTKPAPSQPVAPVSKGLVNIVCNPSCDDVVIAGRSYGPSPVVRIELAAGTHDVTLKRKTQADSRTQIVVTAGQVTSHDFKLATQVAPSSTPAPDVAARVAKFARAVDGWINVQCDPGCDEVIVAGKRFTGAGLANIAVAPGTYEVTVKKKGVADKIIKVRVVDGQTSAMRVYMHPEVQTPAPKKVVEKPSEPVKK